MGKFPTFLLLIKALCITTQIVSAHMVNNNPNHHREILDPQGRYELEWIVDRELKTVTFNVSVLTKGFVGFGLSDNGKMTGADIVIGGVLPSGRSYFSDRHAVGRQTPDLDESQDWTLLSAKETATRTMLTFSRKFDTCDPQDYPITENKISLLWSFGERDDIRYHFGNRGIYQVYLLHPTYVPEIVRSDRDKGGYQQGDPIILDKTHKDTTVWSIRNKIQLPPQSTTYWCTLHKAPELPSKHHAIGFEVRLIGDQSVRHTHHLNVFKCHAPPGRKTSQMFDPFVSHRGQECLSLRSPRGPIPTEYCTEFFEAWGIGGRAIFIPPHVGVPFGSQRDEYYIVQHHLDNPEMLSGVEVETSLDVFYTPKLRENEGGLMFIRNEFPGLPESTLIPPRTVDHQLNGFCSSECTQKMFPKQGITIYASLLHTHYQGKMARLQHFRGNQELEWIDNDDNYGNNFQPFKILQNERKILPGDMLVANCAYDTSNLNRTVVGGFSTTQEMCVVAIMYYGRLADDAFQQCSSEIRSVEKRKYFLAGVENITYSESRLEWIVQEPRHLAGMAITEVSDSQVDWTLKKREELERFHLLHPHWGSCIRELYAGGPAASGTIGAGSITMPTGSEAGGPVGFPRKAKIYQPERSCSFTNL